ncbi:MULTISPECIES: hypothetical protein [unclassified Cellulophaga]|uniref:hypothetical protein n=1 Tax=unclassified Cellulophaga TaxID=2634405 RepID=UPI0026E2C293|nr:MULTISPECIES: hypothetical protein [unclassified Cellulophaga]MDO6490696.1 hypothetical protein [Cellulophaga sp. 2_MG-2023]MDO6494110.1 hypothetical protein [Cellulophaga sp. 3_MG-2023]
MKNSLEEFSNTLKDFQSILRTTKFGSKNDFLTRENQTPITHVKEKVLSAELSFLYTNYSTLLILPHIHINTFFSLHPKLHIFGKGAAMTKKHNPWKDGKVVIGHSFNASSKKIWADTTQEHTPIYVTDIEGNFIQLTPTINLFFKLLIELCISYNDNRDKEPKCGSHTNLWDLHREEVVSPYFANRIKDLVSPYEAFLITAVFTQA